MVPDGWTETTLADVAASPISYGVVQTGENVTGGVPCVRVVDMASGPLDPSTMITTSQEISTSYSRTVLQQDDILIALRGIIGRAAIASARLEGCNLTRGIARISPKRSEFSPAFLFQAINGPRFKNYIERQANGSALQEISIGTLRKAKIVVPQQKIEQERIAEILSTWDRAIETTEKLIANSQAQKKALMQQLLTGKKRLPGFEKAWLHIQLGDALSERLERNPGDLQLLSVSQSRGVIPQEEAGRRNISSSDTSKYKVVRAGDLAYNTMRMWQGASALSFLDGIVSPAYTIVTSRPNQSSEFYSYLFKLPEIIHVFRRHSQGLVSDTWNLKYPHFSKIWVNVPELDEQQAIASTLRDADLKLGLEEQRLECLQSEKRAMMQQLLTGKRRVKVEETVDA